MSAEEPEDTSKLEVPEATTPKIIWAIWLTFGKKTDGILTDVLEFCINRIRALHKKEDGWTVNIITKWEEVMAEIASEPILVELLNNSHVGPQHKADTLRYYYLYKYGGVYVDVSSFLVTPLDELWEQNRNGFTCYYMASRIAATWIFKLSGEIYEYVPIQLYQKLLIPQQEAIMEFKNESLDFVAENYFLISSKGNEISKNVLDQLLEFWKASLSSITSEESYCLETNKIIYKLFKDLYNLKTDKLTYFDLGMDYIEEYNLKVYFNCGYLFNYLQLTKAIIEYTYKYNGSMQLVPLNKGRQNVIDRELLSTFSQVICLNNDCNNRVIVFPDQEKNIHLLSAGYNRLSKWSDNRDQRLSWENTLAGEILKEKDPVNVLNELMAIDVKQLKFGAFTRDSAALTDLRSLFESEDTIGLLPSDTYKASVRRPSNVIEFEPGDLVEQKDEETDEETDGIITLPLNYKSKPNSSSAVRIEKEGGKRTKKSKKSKKKIKKIKKSKKTKKSKKPKKKNNYK